jgi:hypothetical protein
LSQLSLAFFSTTNGASSSPFPSIFELSSYPLGIHYRLIASKPHQLVAIAYHKDFVAANYSAYATHLAYIEIASPCKDDL